MANKECGIARDLMPLVIDEAASEESKEFVDGHITTCEECGKVYEEMKSRTDAPAEPAESDAAFAKSLKHMAKRRTAKRWIVLAVALIASVCLFTGSIMAYERLILWHTQPVSFDKIDTFLYQTPSGKAELFIEMRDKDDRIYSASYGNALKSDGKLFLKFALFDPIVKNDFFNRAGKDVGRILDWNDRLWVIDGALYRINVSLSNRNGVYEIDDPMPVEAIYYETNDERVCVYQAGDEIPVVTETEYLASLYTAGNGYVYDLPDDFWEATDFYVLRAKAMLRGEELPPIPLVRKENLSTLSEPNMSTVSEPDETTVPADSTQGDDKTSNAETPSGIADIANSAKTESARDGERELMGE